jgi:nickel transport protein
MRKEIIMKRTLFILLLGCLLTLGLTATAFAHGAQITYQLKTTVEIEATYDSGEPMAEGQVTVYAPDDPATPWLTGVCDEEGRFAFTPDPSIPGTWDVQVRQAGHGDMVHIPIGEEGAAASGTGFTPLQIVLMAGSVVWGAVGTALFFSRRGS